MIGSVEFRACFSNHPGNFQHQRVDQILKIWDLSRAIWEYFFFFFLIHFLCNINEFKRFLFLPSKSLPSLTAINCGENPML